MPSSISGPPLGQVLPAFSALHLSDKEEVIVALCIKYAIRGAPLTLLDFIELTGRYKCHTETQRSFGQEA